MKLFSLLAVHVLCCFFLQPVTPPPKHFAAPVVKPRPAAEDLFGTDEVLQINLSGSVRALFNDRGDNAAYHPLTLTYKGTNNNTVSVPLKARTRGNFRRDRNNCTYPPILLNFQKATSKGTLFEKQDKMKLVMPCRGEEFVVREYLVYKLYNLITPKSYRARLAKVTFYDSLRKKDAGSFHGILLEEDDQMAARNGTRILEKKGIQGVNTETETFLKMAVFQYMIGNTDWSVPYLHNIRIVAFDSLSIPSVVPYDFDHAGIVNAPYALPPEQLELRSTQDRRFRGYCITDMKAFDETIATFNRLKGDIYALYTTCTLLDPRYVSATTRFLDQFYETLNNPKKVKTEFSYPCNATQNITIKGLGGN